MVFDEFCKPLLLIWTYVISLGVAHFFRYCFLFLLLIERSFWLIYLCIFWCSISPLILLISKMSPSSWNAAALCAFWPNKTDLIRGFRFSFCCAVYLYILNFLVNYFRNWLFIDGVIGNGVVRILMLEFWWTYVTIYLFKTFQKIILEDLHYWDPSLVWNHSHLSLFSLR